MKVKIKKERRKVENLLILLTVLRDNLEDERKVPDSTEDEVAQLCDEWFDIDWEERFE